MKKIIYLLFSLIILSGCETTNTSGGNINFKGNTARIKIASQGFIDNEKCKFIKSTKHSHAGWSTEQADINKNRIKVANEAVNLNATHYVITGEFNDGWVDVRYKVSITADIYDCKQKEKIEIAEKEKPKQANPKLDIDSDKIVAAGSGSGFFISENGNTITNYHVIEGCELNKVYYNGNQFKANVVAVDKVNDIAILKTDIIPDRVLPISNDDVSLLEDVVVAGYPLGKQVSSAIKTHKGVVTALAGVGDNYSNFQTDASINQGNSGGPILDQKGNVVGIAVATWIEEGVQGVHFGIKSSTLKTFIRANGYKFLPAKNLNLSNKDLGELIMKSTVYVECHMTIANIKKMMAEVENKKAFFKEFK